MQTYQMTADRTVNVNYDISIVNALNNLWQYMTDEQRENCTKRANTIAIHASSNFNWIPDRQYKDLQKLLNRFHDLANGRLENEPTPEIPKDPKNFVEFALKYMLWMSPDKTENVKTLIQYYDEIESELTDSAKIAFNERIDEVKQRYAI